MSINDQQLAFAENYVLGNGNATRAAIAAGYAEASARQTASRLLGLSYVQDAIRRAHTRTLQGRLASKAISVLERILDDDSAPAGVRVDAAKTVLDRAGFSAVRSAVLEPEEKSLESMSLAELEALARQLQRSLDRDRAEDVTALEQSPRTAIERAGG